MAPLLKPTHSGHLPFLWPSAWPGFPLLSAAAPACFPQELVTFWSYGLSRPQALGPGWSLR